MNYKKPALAYRFDADHGVPLHELVPLLGGKGASLAAMTSMGLPVPPGFTLTTDACRRYNEAGWTDELDNIVREEVRILEQTTGRRLGASHFPLLLSVRSGAAQSMPGMMDTVLNVGMTSDVEAGLAAASGNAAFAKDTYRRAVLSFAEVTGGSTGLAEEIAIATNVAEVESILAAACVDVPKEPIGQVVASVQAVFESWSSDRAERYRAVEQIENDLGTAVTVQMMVFGNLGDDSGTGVAFTRDPSTGEPGLMGDFLVSAQGEDVVSGRHWTRPISDMEEIWPEAFEELVGIAEQLERYYADMVDVEFTVERGRLWLLQARPGKRSASAALRIAVDMAEDPNFPIDRAEAVQRCRRHLEDAWTASGEQRNEPENPTVDNGAEIARGLAAAPGSASGVLCTDVDKAVELSDAGTDVVLVRRETSPSDVAGMVSAVGLVTTLGGLVSHAAVVARSWGLPAVVGASDLEIVDGNVVGPMGRVEAGTVVTVDGDEGRLLLGAHTIRRTQAPELNIIRSWAQELDSPPRRSTHDASNRCDPTDNDAAFMSLHAIRIKGMATMETLVAMTGIGPEEMSVHLQSLVERGEVEVVPTRHLYRITKDGKSAHADSLAHAVAGLDLSLLRYVEFLDLNTSVKSLCTDWQIRNGEPNDHTDSDYDAEIVERLCRVDDDAQPLVRSFASVVPWTRRYGVRLADARRRVVAGKPKALTGVMCDSYHDIWMELHEDLILTQGIDRSVERST